VFITSLFALIFTLPYAFPVKPAVSVSYVVGYSNRAAFALLIGGSLLFAVLSAGKLAKQEAVDSRLSTRTLLLAEVFVVSLLGLRIWSGPLGSEGDYVLHRQQLLVAGRHLYTQMDYLYGPLLIMPGFWIKRLFHMAATTGYLISLMSLWIIGTWMLWFAVRSITLSFRNRSLLFAAVLAIEAVYTSVEGTHYTPVRRFVSAASACVIYQVFRRTQNAWKTAAVAVAAVAVCLCVSPEQAIGVAAGTFSWMGLCRLRRRAGFSWGAIAFFGVGVAAAAAIAVRAGMFAEFRAFAEGGFAFPLLATGTNCLILLIYLAGIVAAFKSLLDGQESSSNTMLLCLVGMALLPSALGRCDIAHFSSAMPLLLVGIASLLSMSKIRQWFKVGFLVLWLYSFLTFYPYFLHSIAHEAKHRFLAKRPQVSGSSPLQVQTQPALPEISYHTLPCDRTYYAPTLLLPTDSPYRLNCVDLGYKRGLTDIYTARQIADQITGIEQHGGEPLLLENQPLETIFRPHEASAGVMKYGLEGWAPFIPRDKYAPLSFMSIGDYIVAHYTPGPAILGNQLRIWYPKSSQQP
jgi:hypothetical protein